MASSITILIIFIFLLVYAVEFYTRIDPTLDWYKMNDLIRYKYEFDNNCCGFDEKMRPFYCNYSKNFLKVCKLTFTNEITKISLMAIIFSALGCLVSVISFTLIIFTKLKRASAKTQTSYSSKNLDPESNINLNNNLNANRPSRVDPETRYESRFLPT